MRARPLAVGVAALALCAGLTGAAAAQTYRWSSYPAQVYQYLQGGPGVSAQEQIAQLEEDAAKAQARKALLPPGYRAHMGLLYLELGLTDQALAAWQAEKQAFPEATRYIDYLVLNLQKNGG